ncbi:polyhomeotic-like protein 3 isoform X3 [Anguilla anguilla]|uniref:polyhomeotic-like protein 3 isoform X3 n=1 Tax=Anguilla anguilla TaxID=7936 RepID=UPI0015AC3A32|nr:polyhomeotic-like protein 3 isoform X3 [Anguilla anguilla]
MHAKPAMHLTNAPCIVKLNQLPDSTDPEATDTRSPGEMDSEMSVTTTTSTATTALAATTTTSTSTSTPTRTQAPPTSLYSTPSDRQAVQVIQQAIQRPQNMAAQYLQQMYAAQRQHLLLQTAALQQQQSLASVQQTALSGSRQSPSTSPSPNGNVPQSPSASQASMTLPSSPVTAQLISRSQNPSSTATGGAISQQAMLLGNGSSTCSQAQMYLRTQMLILTPAATVGAVQSELPVISSASSQAASTQVQSLAVRANPSSASPGAQSVPLKASSQGLALVPSIPKMSICPLRPGPQAESPEGPPVSEPRPNEVTRLPSTHQLIVPTSYSSIQPQALVKHQLHCTTSHKGAHHQLIIQQPAGALRQVQPIALRVSAQETPPPSQHCVSIQTLTTPTPATVQSQHCAAVSAATLPSETSQAAMQQQPQQTVVVSPAPPQSPTCQSPAIVIQPQAALVQSQPPSVRLGPSQLLSHVESLPLSVAITSTATAASSQASQHAVSLPQTTPPNPVAPPTSVQALSLQALAVPAGQMLLSEEELPVAEALVQMPFQNLPPPQTIAVDLKVQPAAPTDSSAQGQRLYEAEGMCTEETREDGPLHLRRSMTPTPPTLSPSTRSEGNSEDTATHKDNCTDVSGFPCGTSTGSTSVIRSPGEPPYANSSPPPLLPAVVRSASQHPPASLPGGPESQPLQAIVKPHILTHLIEGFVIQEGLEPFPVSRSSLMVDQQATLPEAQETKSNGGQQPLCDEPMDPEPPENSTDSDMDDAPTAEDGTEEGSMDVLECEFCGKRGYAHTFLRSKRFCSMICVRRFNVSCTKRISLLKADKSGRWARRTDGRRGRPPSRPDGGNREHFLRQVAAPYNNAVDGQPARDEEEEEPPVPMTTRLRRQTELERERERERGLVRTREPLGGVPSSPSTTPPNPTLWTVQEVWSFIYSLPGCQDIAEEFRSQEIDGQALLLLTEEHLMNAMNIRLGPALKICARINSLKDT